MAIKKGNQQHAIYTLEFHDAVEALAQYIEAKLQERLPRHPGTIINLNKDTREISLIVPVVHEEPTLAEPPSGKGGIFH